MKEPNYFHDNEVILNYSAEFVTSGQQVLDSAFFNTFLDNYLDYLEDNRRDIREFLYQGNRSREQVKTDLKNFFHLIMIMNMQKTELPYVQFPDKLMEVVEDMYRWWRSKQRYAILYSNQTDSYQTNSFMNVDHQINEVVRDLFRTEQITDNLIDLMIDIHEGIGLIAVCLIGIQNGIALLGTPPPVHILNHFHELVGELYIGQFCLLHIHDHDQMKKILQICLHLFSASISLIQKFPDISPVIFKIIQIIIQEGIKKRRIQDLLSRGHKLR